jgi:hypothetical protein
MCEGGGNGRVAERLAPLLAGSEGGHDLGAAAGPDLAGVFTVGDIADVVEGFDARVTAYPSGELAGVAWLASPGR